MTSCSVMGESHILQMHNSLLNKVGDFAVQTLNEFYIENALNAKFMEQSA